MTAKPDGKRRRGRFRPIADRLDPILDPVLKKRGFANRDLVAHWTTIVPPPFAAMTQPEKLAWSRGEAGAEGAVLHVRCADGEKLALAHEGQRIADAINRYFGFFVVARIQISPAPFRPHSATTTHLPPDVPEPVRRKVRQSVEKVEDPDLKSALTRLGEAIAGRRDR